MGLPVRGTYHYAVPPALDAGARVGARVLVPFGGRGVTGVIVRRCGEAPTAHVKAVRDVLDEAPALDAGLVDLCLWIADYYEAPPGEVLRAALPAGTAVAWNARARLTDEGKAALAGAATAALGDVSRQPASPAPCMSFAIRLENRFADSLRRRRRGRSRGSTPRRAAWPAARG